MEFLEISEEAFRKSLTENLKPSSGHCDFAQKEFF